jgi:hypothetical protein
MTSLNEERVQLIHSRLGFQGDTLLKALQRLKEGAARDLSRLASANPGWDSERDARLVAFRKFTHTVERTQFQIQLLGQLADDDWCRANLEDRGEANAEYWRALAAEFETATRYAFGMSVFTLIENYFRTFLRALDPLVCNRATDPFPNICECLFGAKQLKFPSQARKETVELLHLVRLLRVLIHNDDVYLTEETKTEAASYQGSLYTFRHGQPAGYVTWDLLLNLAEDLRQLLAEVIDHPKVNQLDHIGDLSLVHGG